MFQSNGGSVNEWGQRINLLFDWFGPDKINADARHVVGTTLFTPSTSAQLSPYLFRRLCESLWNLHATNDFAATQIHSQKPPPCDSPWNICFWRASNGRPSVGRQETAQDRRRYNNQKNFYLSFFFVRCLARDNETHMYSEIANEPTLITLARKYSLALAAFISALVALLVDGELPKSSLLTIW